MLYSISFSIPGYCTLRRREYVLRKVSARNTLLCRSPTFEFIAICKQTSHWNSSYNLLSTILYRDSQCVHAVTCKQPAAAQSGGKGSECESFITRVNSDTAFVGESAQSRVTKYQCKRANSIRLQYTISRTISREPGIHACSYSCKAPYNRQASQDLDSLDTSFASG